MVYAKIIQDGNTLIDLTQDTVNAESMLSGTTAHKNDGTVVTGTIQNQSAQTIIPTTTDQTIASGKYLTGVQTIKGDANLVAANIAKDVTIFGVTGTHEGGESGGNVTTVEFGDDSVFTADYIGYVDGNGEYQNASSLAVMSAVSYQMLAGSIVCTIHSVNPAMSEAFMNLPSTLTLVATHTAGPSRQQIYIWIFQVAQ